VHLPERLRDQLKQPLGILLPESDTTKENILKKIPKGAFIITVGDATTEKMIRFDFNPSLQIVDSVEKRSKRELPEGRMETILACKNPAGEITEESISIIRSALNMVPPVRIIVSGEEDLLVLPVVVYAPDNSVILYGQPNEGLVLVYMTEEVRNRARSIMGLMI
jgi:uncharacterized protein (UPF0218 family)